MSAQVLVIGIDAVSPSLLLRLIADGRLPAIRSLMDRGVSGSVRGVTALFIGSTWPSFYTGLDPAGHGLHRIQQLRPGSYEFIRPLDAPDGTAGVPFWKIASDAGRRVAVLDVPLSRLDPGINGVQTVEWGGHDSVFGFQAFPPELAKQVLSTVGPYPMPPSCDGRRRSAADFEFFLAGLERAVEKKTELTLDLLGRERWDLFVQVFTEAHCAGHQCWHLHDPTHPAHDPALAAALGDPLERIDRALDRAVGRIADRAGDAQILLVSAHGMGPFRGASFLLPEILFRLGAAARPSAGSASAGERGWVRPARAAWNLLPSAMRASLRPLRNGLSRRGAASRESPAIGVDLGASRCFPVANGFPVGAIRLNLAGREPQGILSPGREADAFCDELERDLRAIIDERTGGLLVEAVHRTDDLYRGDRGDSLPDLLVEWNATPVGSVGLANGRGSIIRAHSARIGTVEGANHYERTGDHIPTGWFVWSGPGIPAARRAQPVSVMDFHPTLCARLGLAAPAVRGSVIAELVPPRALA